MLFLYILPILLAGTLLADEQNEADLYPHCTGNTVKPIKSPHIVFVVDTGMGTEKAAKVQYLYRSILCEIPDTGNKVKIAISEGGKVKPSVWTTASDSRKHLNVKGSGTPSPHSACDRLSVLPRDLLKEMATHDQDAHIFVPVEDSDFKGACDSKTYQETFRKLAANSGINARNVHLDTVHFGDKSNQSIPGMRIHVKSWDEISLNMTSVQKTTSKAQIPLLVAYSDIIEAYGALTHQMFSEDIENDVVDRNIVQREANLETAVNTSTQPTTTEPSTTIETVPSVGSSAMTNSTTSTTTSMISEKKKASDFFQGNSSIANDTDALLREGLAANVSPVSQSNVTTTEVTSTTEHHENPVFEWFVDDGGWKWILLAAFLIVIILTVCGVCITIQKSTKVSEDQQKLLDTPTSEGQDRLENGQLNIRPPVGAVLDPYSPEEDNPDIVDASVKMTDPVEENEANQEPPRAKVAKPRAVEPMKKYKEINADF